MKEFKFENFFNIIKDKLDNKILQIINENKSKNIQNLVIEWFLLPKTIAFQMSDYSILISPSEKDREKSLLKRDENETTEKIKKRTEAIPIDYNDYNYDKISINTYQKGCYDKDIEEIVKQQENVRRKEPGTQVSKESLFSSQEIGKNTINTPTKNKNKAQKQVQQDEKMLQQVQEIEDNQLK